MWHQCSALRPAIRSPAMSEHTRPLAGRFADHRTDRPDWILDGICGWMAAAFKICMMDRCSSLDERAVPNLHSCGQLPPRSGYRRPEQTRFQHGILVARGGSTAPRLGFSRRDRCHTVDRMWHLVVAKSLGRVAPETERVTTGLRRAASRYSGALHRAKRECATTRMRAP